MGVPYFIDRDFTELADARGLRDLLPLVPQVAAVLPSCGWPLRCRCRRTPCRRLLGGRSNPCSPAAPALQLNVLDLLGQHDWRLGQFFKDPRLRAMFTFQGVLPWCAWPAFCAR